MERLKWQGLLRDCRKVLFTLLSISRIPAAALGFGAAEHCSNSLIRGRIFQRSPKCLRPEFYGGWEAAFGENRTGSGPVRRQLAGWVSICGFSVAHRK